MKKRLIHLFSILAITVANLAESAETSLGSKVPAASIAKAANVAVLPATFPGDVDLLAFRVVEKRRNAVLRGLLNQGLSANFRSSDGTTLLMYAALHGDAEGVRILLESGADPNATNHHGATALIWGAADIEKARLLVERGANVNAKTKGGATPLTAAAAHTEGADSLAFLLKAGADNSISVGHPLLFAARVGNLESVRILLEQRAKQPGTAPSPYQTIVNAAQKGHWDIATYLLEQDGRGKPTQEELSKILRIALRYPDTQIARKLLDLGTSVSEVKLFDGAYSDIEDDDGIITLLIERGANVHAKGFRGYTALDFARLRGHRKTERILAGAGVKSKGKLKQIDIPQNNIHLTPINQDAVISNSVTKSLDLLLSSSDHFLKSRESCTSCHHQDLPAVAASIAQSRGIIVRRNSLDLINFKKVAEWELDEFYDRDQISPDPSKDLGYLLWGRAAQGLPANPLTKAAVWYLAGRQLADGQWRQGLFSRMPLQDGAHMATALVIQAFRMYPLEGREAELSERIVRARRWLEKTPAQILTHQAFRLLGLAWADADPSVLQHGIEELIKTQKPDGGWAQLVNLESDAWATGLTLLSVQAAGLETTHAAYRHGMEFLLSTQFEDGSWFVRTRSSPVQPHFDSHFPFGWDQWISAAGTALASASLALALDTVETQAPQFTSAASFAHLSANNVQQDSTRAGTPFVFKGVRTVDFQKDIRPILEESCLDCHSGDKAKGKFSMVDRTHLIRGGLSSVATFVPGHGDESQIIRHVTDKVEDMEMPPLAKRKTYPVLTLEQVQTLITWINEGADWPEGVVLEE